MVTLRMAVVVRQIAVVLKKFDLRINEWIALKCQLNMNPYSLFVSLAGSMVMLSSFARSRPE